MALCFVGGLYCLTWWATSRSYKELGLAKIKVIQEIGKVLPVALCERGWQAYREQAPRYMPVTNLEGWLPILFSIIYVA